GVRPWPLPTSRPAHFLSAIACRWQTSQACSHRHHEKAPDRAEHCSQTRSKLRLNLRQLLTAPHTMNASVFATTPSRGSSVSRYLSTDSVIQNQGKPILGLNPKKQIL